MNKITIIEKLENFGIAPIGQIDGTGGQRLGMGGMISQMCGYSSYDGFKIVTTDHEYLLLIDNCQSCCESWGYTETNDDVNDFIGAAIQDVKFTDTALNTAKLKGLMWDGKIDLDAGGIQFVDFETDKGVLQFAVYNAHNGYYGHSIVFTKDKEILLRNVL